MSSVIILIPLVILLVVSLGLTVQYSYGGSKIPEPEFEEELETEGSKSQETPDNKSEFEKQPEIGDTEVSESNDTSETTFNITSGILRQDTVATTSNLTVTPGNESIGTVANLTGSPKFSPKGQGIQAEGSGVLQELQTEKPPIYEVIVRFDSITVHDDHEGPLSGDGEYDISAYVQGILISLTDASGQGADIWDVSAGETVFFKPGTEVAVDIPTTYRLSIMTVGSEVDGCGRTGFQKNIQTTLGGGILQFITVDNLKIPELVSYHNTLSTFPNNGCGPVTVNENDILGLINKIYDPPGYGAGSHEDKSSSGDFTLRYNIRVTRIQ